MQGALKGMVVAFANTFVIGLMIAAQQHHMTLDFAVMVVMLGFIPAMLIGAFVGHVLSRMGNAHRVILLIVMAAFACLGVMAIADEYAAQEFVRMACVPTVICCFVLERWTRQHLVLS